MKTKEYPSQEYLKECLDYNPDTGEFTWKKRPVHHFLSRKGMRIYNKKYVGKAAGTVLKSHAGKRYLVIMISGSQYKAHNLAWIIQNGCLDCEFIDHINGNGIDNRISNLSPVTLIENNRNHKLRSDNTSGHSGVTRYGNSGKWLARISNGTSRINLGVFSNFEDAVKARKAAEVQYGYHENHGTERPL